MSKDLLPILLIQAIEYAQKVLDSGYPKTSVLVMALIAITPITWKILDVWTWSSEEVHPKKPRNKPASPKN